ncbi:nickel-dependent lactate racemase [Silvibacterium bohemicum]|uniref:Nickel-dependent lactate racemase n=1 Tax=Silvibacterium bohemicum TaxID=1577686 RepID=A0A841JNQ7_9BACT|nr:lactate racemase domain-containing protein [Silvibacterium bohemicum]MBB6142780.1 nickel-dependent lactate racemase [Silvibacterium bohemicum]
MSLYLAQGSPDAEFTPEELKALLFEALGKLGARKRVLAVPPDQTRFHSRAGELTGFAWEYYGEHLAAILPALGTHAAMSPEQLTRMYGAIPHHLFHVHNWRSDVETLGEVPAEFIHEVSEGKLNYAYPAQVNRMISRGGYDLVLSIGQVVPHEVIGMANYNKNILVGAGGVDGINRSHYLGAVYGMERIMGRAENPVRAVLNYAADRFLGDIPIAYVQTVVGRAPDGSLALRGIYVGDDAECFHLAAELSLKVNFEMLDQPIRKAVVYLDPHEFHSTWLGNKAIYRTRMALADDAELIVLAPAVEEFGEDPTIDRLIRKYGYRGTPATLDAVKNNADLAADLSAAAHLIHGSSEGRFKITWCPGKLTREEVEGVGFRYGELGPMMQRYNPEKLHHGYNNVDGEEIFFISNPGLGLWAYRGRFE